MQESYFFPFTIPFELSILCAQAANNAFNVGDYAGEFVSNLIAASGADHEDIHIVGFRHVLSFPCGGFLRIGYVHIALMLSLQFQPWSARSRSCRKDNSR